ncbi:MAG: glycosyltransferase family 39 protein, partial [Clostridia bacterium]|nr:glycosyltransferase family 39 protein [Clostridia bacterium]
FFSITTTVFFNVIINFAGENCFFKTDNIFLNILSLFIVIVLLYILYKKLLKKINKKYLFLFTVFFSLITGFLWVNYLKLEPVSDQYMVYYCANRIINNDLKTVLGAGNYLSRNPHQLGFVLYIISIFKIFHITSILFIQNLTVIFSSVCVVTLYFIVKELFKNDIIHKISLLLISFFAIYLSFFSPHVYGNIPGLAFGLIAILFTLKYIMSNKFWQLLIVGISIFISYLLKNNYEIFLIAIIIELFFKSLKDLNRKSIIGIIAIVSIVFASKAIVYNCFEKTTGFTLNNGVPAISYLYMGIAEPVTLSPGWYTGDVENIYNESGYNKQKSIEITKKLLSKRINYLFKNINDSYGYFKAKIQTTWLNPTFQTIWCSTPGIVLEQNPAYNNYISQKKLLISIVCGKAYHLEERLMDIYQIIIFLSASYSLILIFKYGSLKHLLLPIIFLGGFTFHLIWETKAIYVLQYYFLILPYSAFGIYRFLLLINKKIKNTETIFYKLKKKG